MHESQCQTPERAEQLFSLMHSHSGPWGRTHRITDYHPSAATGYAFSSSCWWLYLNYHALTSTFFFGLASYSFWVYSLPHFSVPQRKTRVMFHPVFLFNLIGILLHEAQWQVGTLKAFSLSYSLTLHLGSESSLQGIHLLLANTIPTPVSQM